VTAVVRRIDRWLFAPGPASRLWGVRFGLTALMAYRFLVGQWEDLAGQPAALFRPPLFLRWLDQMPSERVILTLHLVGLVAAVLALIGRKVRVTFAVAWLCFVVLEGLIDSRVKISHNQVLLILACVPVLLAPAVSSWKDRRRSVAFGWPVQAALVVLASAYFFTGLGKVLKSGWSWVASDNLRWVLAAGVRSDKPPTDGIAQFVVDHPGLAHLVAFGAIAIELGFVLVVFVRRSRPWFALGSVAIHVGTYLCLGLEYGSWMGTALIVLLPWERLLPDGQASSASLAVRSSSSRAHET
jgi:hypothetical protein